MKAEELMIGDWVISKKRGKDEILQVVTADGGSNTFWLDGDSYSGLVKGDDIFPIPLTTEILEKNGFELSKRDPMHGTFKHWKVTIEIGKSTAQSGKVLRVQIHEFGYASKTFNLPLPKYVHELQHAMKQCRIKKTITI